MPRLLHHIDGGRAVRLQNARARTHPKLFRGCGLNLIRDRFGINVSYIKCSDKFIVDLAKADYVGWTDTQHIACNKKDYQKLELLICATASGPLTFTKFTSFVRRWRFWRTEIGKFDLETMQRINLVH